MNETRSEKIDADICSYSIIYVTTINCISMAATQNTSINSD